MDKRTEEISKIILSLDAARFISCLDRYVKTSGIQDPAKGKNRECDEKSYAETEQEAEIILLQSDLSVKHLLDFRFKMNGHDAESGQKTQHYFRQMRRHQIEILMQVSEETEMILNMIRYSEKMRDLMRNHSELLQQSELLMDAVGGRISRESAVSVKPEYCRHDLAEVKKLAGTFQSVKDYDEAYRGNIPKNRARLKADRAAVFHDLIRDIRKGIEGKKKKLGEDIRELRQGWKVLSILATTGYSRRIRRSVNALVKAHNTRVAEFREYIQQCRSGFSGFED